MAVILELGTEEQKQLIREELQSILSAVEGLDPPLNVTDIILASDFDATVNKLQGTADYRSSRGVQAVAKCVSVQGTSNVSIVLSSRVFGGDQDQFTRFSIYMHELIHAANKVRFPSISQSSPAVHIYLANLHTFYDEYTADRRASSSLRALLDRLGLETTPLLAKQAQEELSWQISLINDPARYEHVRTAIRDFRVHGNVDRFMHDVYADFDDISLCLVHLWASLDEYPALNQSVDLSLSHFVNDRTTRLWEFMRNKYEQNSYELTEGSGILEAYMTNFGYRFVDQPTGPYCYVLDV